MEREYIVSTMPTKIHKVLVMIIIYIKKKAIYIKKKK